MTEVVVSFTACFHSVIPILLMPKYASFALLFARFAVTSQSFSKTITSKHNEYIL